MKKSLILPIALIVAVFAFVFVMPANAWTLKFNKFKKTYQGTWANTKSECFTPGNTGTITVKLSQLKKVNKYYAKVTSGWVWFNNGVYGGMKAKGKITVSKNGKLKKLRLDYGKEEYGTYYISGTLSGSKLKGKYVHTGNEGSGYEGCTWRGNIGLTISQ